MSRIPKNKSRELTPEGAHVASLCQIIDLGTQDGGEYGPRHKIQLAYEVLGMKTSTGEAYVSYRQYTYSPSPKGNLMKDLKSGFNVKDADVEMDDLLGRTCLITIEHADTDAGTFANVTNVGQVPRGTKIPKAVEELKSLYLDDSFDQEVYDSLPDFLKEKIASSPEYAEVMTPRMKQKKQKALPPQKTNGKSQPVKNKKR